MFAVISPLYSQRGDEGEFEIIQLKLPPTPSLNKRGGGSFGADKNALRRIL